MTETTTTPAISNGQICHTELVTKDVAATRDFMAKTFDWQFEDAPMPGSDQPYVMWTPKGGGTGGGVTPAMAPEQPPSTLNYLAVDDADAYQAKVESHGGKILQPAFDIEGVGRMFVFEVPGGPVMACWQEKAKA